MYIGEFNVEPHSELYKNKQIRTEFQMGSKILLFAYEVQ